MRKHQLVVSNCNFCLHEQARLIVYSFSLKKQRLCQRPRHGLHSSVSEPAACIPNPPDVLRHRARAACTKHGLVQPTCRRGSPAITTRCQVTSRVRHRPSAPDSRTLGAGRRRVIVASDGCISRSPFRRSVDAAGAIGARSVTRARGRRVRRHSLSLTVPAVAGRPAPLSCHTGQPGGRGRGRGRGRCRSCWAMPGDGSGHGSHGNA